MRRIAPGDPTPVHAHRWPCTFYILSWSAFVRRDGEGKVIVDSRTLQQIKNSPQTLWSAPLPPHSLQNVSETDLRVINVELKQGTGVGADGTK
jgi:hypothetical protein